MRSGICVRQERCAGNGGFTMIEVLVAFVVLATLTLAVQQGLASSLSSMTRAKTRLGAEVVARTLIIAPLASGPSAAQSQSGRMNGYDWRIRFEMLELPVTDRNVKDGASPRWRPVRMVISVSTSSRPEFTVETIRLVGG